MNPPPALRLTERRVAILAYCSHYLFARHWRRFPTQREIAHGVGLARATSVCRHLKLLCACGFIAKDDRGRVCQVTHNGLNVIIADAKAKHRAEVLARQLERRRNNGKTTNA